MNDLILYAIGHFAAFACALIGFVYSDMLTEPDHIFHRLYKWLEKWLSPEFDFIFKPIIGCYRCVSGQIALWVFLKILWVGYACGQIFTTVFMHIYFICLTIFISWMISKQYRASR